MRISWLAMNNHSAWLFWLLHAMYLRNWTLYLLILIDAASRFLWMGKWEYDNLLASSYKEVCSHGSQVHEHCSFSCPKTCLCQWSVSGQCVNPICAIVTTEITKHMESFVISQAVKCKHLIESQSWWNRNVIFHTVKTLLQGQSSSINGGQIFFLTVTRSSLWESPPSWCFGGFKVASFPGSQVAWEWG